MKPAHLLAITAVLAVAASPAAAKPVTRPHAALKVARVNAAAPHAAAGSTAPDVGARSAGDELFPTLGNGGYDVQHYDLNLAYTPVVHQLSGTTTISAVATQPLREFSLDFQGFAISALTVDGVPAGFSRADTKLIIDPKTPLVDGQTFTVAVTYSGQPPTITDPDGSTEGFLQTGDGAFVVCEPMGAQGWYPDNNTPADKATFDLHMAVPIGLTVLGNGILASQTTDPATGSTTFNWHEAEPMATYLATASLGVFDVTHSEHDGISIDIGVDPAYLPVTASSAATDEGAFDRIPAILDLFKSLYGPYPFTEAGAIVDVAPTVGYSLETQTKPNFPLPLDSVTIAHETAHQYFGDSVSLTQWKDIWLNEGFATWSQWVFDERSNGGATTRSDYESVYANSASFWTIPPADPGSAANIFSSAVYDRGGATLEALREIVGEPTFLQILRDWVTRHRHANATTPQFIALAEADSGKDLGAFFAQWLYGKTKPTITPDNFGK